jgi:hypothetical protein
VAESFASDFGLVEVPTKGSWTMSMVSGSPAREEPPIQILGFCDCLTRQCLVP